MKNKLNKLTSMFLSILILIATCICPTVVSAAETTTDLGETKVLHFQANNKGPLAQRDTLIEGETYVFSFSLSNGLGFKVDLFDNNSRNKAKGATATQISATDKGKYTEYVYEVLVPDIFSGDATSGFAFVGIEFNTKITDGYFFNASLYNKSDASKTEIFENGDFSSGYLNYWCWRWNRTTLNADNVASGTYDHSDGSVFLEVVSFEDTPMYEEVSEPEPEPEPTTPKMLHITSNHTGPLGSRIAVTAGETYIFKFGISNTLNFNVVMHDNDTRNKNLNATATLKNSEGKGGYTYYEYEVTVPSTYEKSYAILGITFNGTAPYEGYFFDASAYKTSDTEKKELFGNGIFADGTLNNWVWKYHNFGSNNLTSETFTEDNKQVTVEVVEFDETLMPDTTPEPEPEPEPNDPAIPNMLHITSNHTGPLGSQIDSTAGETYTFKFGLSNNLDFNVVLHDRDSRSTNLNAIVEPINSENKGRYTYYEYEVTVPSTYVKDTVVLGITFKGTAPYDGYFFDASAYKTTDTEKKELFGNGVFADGTLNKWVWKYHNFGSNNLTSETFTEDKKQVTVEVIDFDESKMLGEKQMMLLDDARTTSNELFVLETQSLQANVEYTLSFDYKFESGALNKTLYYYVCGGTNDPGSLQTVSKQFFSTRTENENLFTTISNNGRNFVCTFTLTQEQVDSCNHFYAGFKFLTLNTKTKLYFANMTLYETNDTDKTNLFLNDEYATKVMNWYSHWGRSNQGYDVFGRSNIEFTARYLPYDASLFESPTDIHYGDTELDGDIDILDLVTVDEIIDAGSEYIPNVDVNNSGAVNQYDINAIKRHMIGTQPIEWTQKGHGLMEGANLSGGADEEAEELRNQILSATDSLKQGTGWLNKTVYVAEDGNDSLLNPGTSKDNPITINKLSSITLRSGDLVLFKRGDTFRLSEEIRPVDGVSYGAYGEGDKPKLLGSLKNYANESWTTDDNIIWKVYLGTSEAAQVVFNDGEWVGYLKPTLDEVVNDGDFYYDTTEMVLYLYLNQINPAKYFDSIEIATTMRAFNKHGDTETNDNNFQNLCFKYFTFGAMNLSFTDNVQITNCEMGWLGGKLKSNGTRYGNAIQLWRHSNNTTVSNNYIYQVFDAAITFQGSHDNDYTNLTFNDNLIEYCSMNFEFWGNSKNEATDTSADYYTTMYNIAFEDNILRFGGYGYAGMQRTTQENQAMVLCWNTEYNEDQIQDFTIKNNIFDTATCYFYYGTPTFEYVDISSNTYYQGSGSNLPVVKGQKYYCDDITAFEAAVKAVDANPTKVEWVN